ncbi:uncharacterized protein FSUBG_3313 [Fusarium subglutinans]|uniref:Uncharacterized protein n=1 Tax=Gibberella subglutinans TaxID=42677 RepID=A0A8H5V482_GIBSU|nr:uncharacterized protein FSUBG_3313 [Fusarium subglutinans]KAF5610397.1 hypothetical protein FSUBG_3313 [Fusarium subglutinans]
MNPCAPTFIPVDPSEDEFSSDEDESSTPSSMEVRHPEQDVRSPRARPRGRTIPSITIDPEGYDSMFPALGSVNQVDPLKIRSPKMKQKQRSRCRRPRGKDDRGLSSELVNDEQLSIEHQFSQCADDEEETSKQPPLEYLKPTVYTPRKSLEFLKPDVYTPPASSHNSTSRPKTRGSMRPAISRARTRSPRRAWRPPTPHPDGRPRGSRLRRTPAPDQRFMSSAGYPVPLVSPNPTYSHFPSEPPHPMMHHPINYAPRMGPSLVPPMMPFSPLAWPLAPVPWSAHLALPEVVMDYPEDYDSHYEQMDWPSFEGDSGMYYAPQPAANLPPQHFVYYQPHSQYRMHLQPPERSGFHPTSRGSDSQSESRSQPSRSQHEQKASTSSSAKASNSSSGAATNVSDTTTPLRTQFDMIKDQSGGAQLRSKHNNAVCSDDSTQEDVKKELRKAADYSKIKGFIPTRQAQNSHDSPRVGRGAKINLKRETTPQEENKAQETHRLVDPLQNAPRGPSSARQLPQTFSSTLKQTFNLNGSESGSWSQSKRWTSFATKERQAFQKMMANLRYMSADQSPFVPQSPVELTAFKANLAESKTRKLDQEVKQRLARTNASVDEGAETQVQPVVEFLRGKKFDDGLSPVFAASNCFSTSQNQPPYGAGWPTLAELKEEGDKRSSRQGRCLPLPKLDLVSHTLWSETSGACSSDGAVRNDKRTVQVGSHYLCPVTPEEPSIAPPIELQPEELPFILAELLQSIDAAEDDAEWTEENNEKMIGQDHEEKAKEKGKGAKD